MPDEKRFEQEKKNVLILQFNSQYSKQFINWFETRKKNMKEDKKKI